MNFSRERDRIVVSLASQNATNITLVVVLWPCVSAEVFASVFLAPKTLLWPPLKQVTVRPLEP